MLFRTAGIQIHVAHLQRLPYCTIEVLGAAVARKATVMVRPRKAGNYKKNRHFFVSRPPATLAVRGRFLTMVCLIIAPSSSRPLTTLAVRGRFLRVLCLTIALAFSFNYFSARS